MIVLLASQSPLKISVVENFFQMSPFQVQAVSVEGCGNPEQPVNSGDRCAWRRLKEIFCPIYGATKKYTSDIQSMKEEMSMSISIENEIVIIDHEAFDVAVCCVRLPNGEAFFGKSSEKYRAKIPYEAYEKVRERAEITPDGMSLTLGKEYFAKELGLSHDNWHKDYAGFDRRDQMMDALLDALSKLLMAKIQIFPDFPKEGVQFKYQGGIWSHPVYHALLNCLIVSKIQHLGIPCTKIAGLDSRGYISGAVVAHMLGVGFVPITKAGKTPGTVFSVEGSTEYSNIKLEVNPELLTRNDEVILMDDLVATGGSLLAAKHLVQMCGANVSACVSILRVDPIFHIAEKELAPTRIICILDK